MELITNLTQRIEQRDVWELLGQYTSTGNKTVSDLSAYRQIVLVPLENLSSNNIVQSPAILPIELFRTHGYLQSAMNSSSGFRYFNILYVNDTTINVNSLTSGFAIEIYGVK